MATMQPLKQGGWVGFYKPQEGAKVRMYCFYGAGGTAAMFQPWYKIMAKEFPEVELCAVEWPGHGSHEGEFLTDAKQWTADFREKVINPARKEWFGAPFVFLAQSTGARLAYDVIRELKKDRVEPLKMYVVARSPPTVPDLKWVEEAPDDTLNYLNWITEELLESQKERMLQLWQRLPKEELVKREKHFRADLELNSSPVAPLGLTSWKVVAPEGKLVKRNTPTSDKMIQIKRDTGSILQTTGQEYVGPSGGKWVELDPEAGEKNRGWLLVHGKTVGVNSELLEAVVPEEGAEPFWKTPVPLQIHLSDADRVHPWKDPSGRLQPQAEWAQLCVQEPEYVQYKGLLHDELLMHPSVLDNVCKDIIRMCKLRDS